MHVENTLTALIRL